MPTKTPWQSKTLWLNLIVALAAFFPAIATQLHHSPELGMAGFAVLNIVLRLITNGKISLSDEQK